MTEILWDKEAKRIKSEKELRLFVRRFLKERLRGLPPDFRLEVSVQSLKPRKVIVKIPAHSEGSPIRIAQVDYLLEELASFGIDVEPLYLDDLAEKEFGT